MMGNEISQQPVSGTSRRRFLVGSAIAAGGLALGFGLSGRTRSSLGESVDEDGARVTAWLKIAPDDQVTIALTQSEMGQGVYTALPMIVAEELEADWEKVRVEIAPTAPESVNPKPGPFGRLTGGSTSVRRNFELLSLAGATAREMLKAAAARRWNARLEDCAAERGVVRHRVTGASFTYGALAGEAAEIPPPEAPPLKAPAERRIVGRPAPRLDTPQKVTGRARFGIDVAAEGMLVATVRQAPVAGARLAGVDPAPALSVRGVRKVIPLEDAVIVAADGYWPAKKGLDTLDPRWTASPRDGLSTDALKASYLAALNGPAKEVVAEGDVEQVLAAAERRVEAVYDLPFLAHATMEPMNATAHVGPDFAHIWAPTQAANRTQYEVAKLTGLAPDQVNVTTTFLGGGFGRRSETDFVMQAVRASMATGGPVKLIWSREEDMRHDFYRPMSASRFRAGLDRDGMPVAWDNRLVAGSIMARVRPQSTEGGIDRSAVEGARELPYAIASRRMSYVLAEESLPVGFWRSVGHSHNGFYVESFVDELAHAGGHDPVAFRRRLMGDAYPRHRRVLDRVAEAAGWDRNPPEGRHRGVAVHESFGSIVGQVAEISIEGGEGVRIHRIACAVDCGLAVNPSTIEAQMESGIVYGLTAAFFGEIEARNGAVADGNFDSYRMLKLAHMPAISVHVIEGGPPIGGIGEPGTPPAAPALANAIFAATGRRLRSLPLSRHGLVPA